MNDKRDPWIISLIVFVIWAIIVFGGEILQAAGTSSLNDLVSDKIVIQEEALVAGRRRNWRIIA